MSGSQFRALTIQSGVTTQIQPTNQLLVGNGIDADVTGSLTIGTTTATSVVLGGTATTDVSVNGAATFETGSGAVSLMGNTTVTTGKTFTVTNGLTTLGAGLTQSGGAFSLTGNAASQLSTTGANALTITSGTDATWSTGAGVLSLSGFAGIDLKRGASTLVDVGMTTSTAVTLSAGISLVATSGAGNLDFSNSTGTFQTGGGAVSVNGNTTFTGATTIKVNAFSTAGVVHNDATGLLSTSLINVGADITPGSTAGQVLLTNGTPAWTTVSQDATISATGAVTVVSAHGDFTVGAGGGNHALTIDNAGTFTTGTGTNTINGNVTTGNNPNFDFSGSSGTFKTSAGANTLTGATTASSTLTSTGLLTASNSLTVSAGNITTPLTNWGTVQVNGSGVLTSTTGTSGQLLISQGGSAASTWNTVSGDGTLSSSGVLTVTQAAGNFEVKGNLMVDGAETIVGTSTFQSNASFDGDVTIVDGYYLQTELIQSDGYLNVNAANGINLQSAGVTYLEVGTTASGTNFIAVPSGITLQAQAGGQIIATSSSGTSYTELPNSVVAQTQSAGTPVYLTSSGVTTPTDSSAIASSYFVGISLGSGNGTIVDGVATVTVVSGTVGMPVYLGTSGTLTGVAPSAGVVAQVGIYVKANTMLLQPITPVVL